MRRTKIVLRHAKRLLRPEVLHIRMSRHEDRTVVIRCGVVEQPPIRPAIALVEPYWLPHSVRRLAKRLVAGIFDLALGFTQEKGSHARAAV